MQSASYFYHTNRPNSELLFDHSLAHDLITLGYSSYNSETLVHFLWDRDESEFKVVWLSTM